MKVKFSGWNVESSKLLHSAYPLRLSVYCAVGRSTSFTSNGMLACD